MNLIRTGKEALTRSGFATANVLPGASRRLDGRRARRYDLLLARALAALCASMLPVLAAAQLHVSTLTAPPSSDGDSSLTFPVVSGGAPGAAARINTWLQVSMLQILPGRYRHDPFEDVALHGDNPPGISSLAYEVKGTTRSYLSIEITGEYDSATINDMDVAYNFDARSGDLLVLADLFSSTGLAQLTKTVRAQRLKEIDDALADLPGSAKTSADDDPADPRHLYLDCRADVAHESLSDLDFLLGRQALLLSKDCTTSHYARATSGAEPIASRLPFTTLAPWLSDYGRCVLVAQRADCVNPRVDVSRGILHGTLGGRYPITLVYGTPASDGYFYDRFAKFIPLDVKASTGDSVRLREFGGDGPDAQFVLQRAADGTFHGTWTQEQTGKHLAVLLR